MSPIEKAMLCFAVASSLYFWSERFKDDWRGVTLLIFSFIYGGAALAFVIMDALS